LIVDLTGLRETRKVVKHTSRCACEGVSGNDLFVYHELNAALSNRARAQMEQNTKEVGTSHLHASVIILEQVPFLLLLSCADI
jgi:hypothetical protein